MVNAFPVLEGVHPTHWWGGYLCVTRNQIPEIGHIDNKIFYAFGYSGHGVVASHVSGEVISKMIVGDKDIPAFVNAFQAENIPLAGYKDAWLGNLGLQWHKFKDFLN